MPFEFTTDMACLQDESTPGAVARRSGDALNLPPEVRLAEVGRSVTIHVAFLDQDNIAHTDITHTDMTTSPAPGSHVELRRAYEAFYTALGLRLLSVQVMVERTHLMVGERRKVGLTLIRGGLVDVDIRL